ncbi:MAG: Rrf2 family transcriptional regulator [Rickettsiales bacterium]|nr:Rrf2 family transcriptional regulator [Rickettsiales bacterium]
MGLGLKKTLIATEAVVYIALRAVPNPVRSREIAEYMGLPVRYLEPLMQKLVRSGILRGIRGPSGGYVLARERRNITVRDIFDCVSDSTYSPDDYISSLHQNIIRPIHAEAAEELRKNFEQRTMQELVSLAQERHIFQQSKRSDFTI